MGIPATRDFTVIGFDDGDLVFVAAVLPGHVTPADSAGATLDLDGWTFTRFAEHAAAGTASGAQAAVLIRRGRLGARIGG